MAAHLFLLFFFLSLSPSLLFSPPPSSLLQQHISFRSPLSTQKDSPCKKKKMLIITSEIGNCIRINKGEITVIMVGLMGSACIIKGRMQRNNTDPLGCAAAPFLKQGRHIRASAASATTEFILFLMVLKYTYRPVLWGRDHKGPHMLLFIIQITVETVLKGSMSSTRFSFLVPLRLMWFWCSTRTHTHTKKIAPSQIYYLSTLYFLVFLTQAI